MNKKLLEAQKIICKECGETNYEVCQKCRVHQIINKDVTPIKSDEEEEDWGM